MFSTNNFTAFNFLMTFENKFTEDRGRKNAYQTISEKKKKYIFFELLGKSVIKLQYKHFPCYETLL